jgi:hypothetical protein
MIQGQDISTNSISSVQLQVGKVVLDFFRGQLSEPWAPGTLNTLDAKEVVGWRPNNACS